MQSFKVEIEDVTGKIHNVVIKAKTPFHAFMITRNSPEFFDIWKIGYVRLN